MAVPWWPWLHPQTWAPPLAFGFIFDWKFASFGPAPVIRLVLYSHPLLQCGSLLQPAGLRAVIGGLGRVTGHWGRPSRGSGAQEYFCLPTLS